MELLVTMLLTFIVMGAIYGVYRVQIHSVKANESRMEAQEYVRAALDMMMREMRNAGYFPVNVTDATCWAGNGGIVIATASTFSFALDADGDGDCGGPTNNETITYALAGGDITRAVDGGAAQLLTNGGVTVFQFAYFPKDCATPSFPLPIGSGSACGVAGTLANIERVSISLTVQSASPDTQFGGQAQINMTSNVDLRNRGL